MVYDKPSYTVHRIIENIEIEIIENFKKLEKFHHMLECAASIT